MKCDFLIIGGGIAGASAAARLSELGRVVLLEEDGCYWFEHDGPVETTLLPLRSRQGGQICTRERS